jgi:cellulose biosynthesis protein BcsQ
MSDAAGRIILVCKLKGGAGATTTCRELAVAVAAVAGGLQVALVDLDSQGHR